MEYLKFKRSPYGFLQMDEGSDIQMEIIGDFLQSDLCFLSKQYLEWLSSDSSATGGNLTYVLKYKDTITIIHSLTDDQITITKDQFIQILTQWELVYKPAPRELLITKIADQFIFEPTYD